MNLFLLWIYSNNEREKLKKDEGGKFDSIPKSHHIQKGPKILPKLPSFSFLIQTLPAKIP